MNENKLDGLSRRPRYSSRVATSYRRTDYLIHPRTLARKDIKGCLLKVIVQVGTAFERFARNPGLESVRRMDRRF